MVLFSKELRYLNWIWYLNFIILKSKKFYIAWDFQILSPFITLLCFDFENQISYFQAAFKDSHNYYVLKKLFSQIRSQILKKVFVQKKRIHHIVLKRLWIWGLSVSHASRFLSLIFRTLSQLFRFSLKKNFCWNFCLDFSFLWLKGCEKDMRLEMIFEI